MTVRKGGRVRETLFFSVAVALFAFPPAALEAQGYVVIHNLEDADGSGPQSTLVQDTDGFFYGMARYLGAHGAGTLFRVDGNNNFAVLHDFAYSDGSQPRGRLLLAQDGYLYGTTAEGGANGGGVIFRLDTSGNNFSVVHHFELGSSSDRDLLQDSAGTLYGVLGYARGVFRIDPSGSNYSVIRAFVVGEGKPISLMLASDGFLYGTTEDGNILFRLGRDGQDFKILHTFTPADDGSVAVGPLIEGADGLLYGTAGLNGPYTGGTAFRLRKDGASFEVIHAFQGAEGTTPAAGLTQVHGGLLYGAAAQGGAGGGTLFRMTTTGALFRAVHVCDGPTGDIPYEALVQGLDEALYGLTYSGGTNDQGVVYRLSIPTIASLSPASGPAGGGTVVVISGSGFQAGAAVTIGGGLAGAVIGPSQITASTPPLAPGTLNDLIVANPDESLAFHENAWLADFLDVPPSNPFHEFVEQIVRHGITSGCGGGNYCGGASVTRAQMAVFLLKAKHGPGYAPPPCAGAFPDVACPSPFADWIEQLAAESITAGCAGGNFCPGNLVTRAQMAVFLLKAEHGSAYVPPPCAGVFGDVSCPSPFADWIERLAAENVTSGCGGGNYCPTASNTRGQMAVFLTRTFGL